MRADVEPGGPPSRTRLFDLSVGLVEDVRERGMVCEGAESFSPRFQLALPYRGFFVWHVGGDDVAGDANQAIFVTGGGEYRISHPVRGGYAELMLSLLRWALADDAPLHPPAPSTRRLLVRTKAYLEWQLAQPIHLAVGAAAHRRCFGRPWKERLAVPVRQPLSRSAKVFAPWAKERSSIGLKEPLLSDGWGPVPDRSSADVRASDEHVVLRDSKRLASIGLLGDRKARDHFTLISVKKCAD
jgi:hypothetical protein